MKKLIYILVILILGWQSLYSQERVDQPAYSSDSITFFDEALAWVDTIDCQAEFFIAELPDSIYKQRLQALPLLIEAPYNDVVRQYILRYTKHSPKQLATLLRRAEYYFPIFEDILAQHELPYELSYLSIVESALNPHARS